MRQKGEALLQELRRLLAERFLQLLMGRSERQ